MSSDRVLRLRLHKLNTSNLPIVTPGKRNARSKSVVERGTLTDSIQQKRKRNQPLNLHESESHADIELISHYMKLSNELVSSKKNAINIKREYMELLEADFVTTQNFKDKHNADQAEIFSLRKELEMLRNQQCVKDVLSTENNNRTRNATAEKQPCLFKILDQPINGTIY